MVAVAAGWKSFHRFADRTQWRAALSANREGIAGPPRLRRTCAEYDAAIQVRDVL